MQTLAFGVACPPTLIWCSDKVHGSSGVASGAFRRSTRLGALLLCGWYRDSPDLGLLRLNVAIQLRPCGAELARS